MTKEVSPGGCLVLLFFYAIAIVIGGFILRATLRFWIPLLQDGATGNVPLWACILASIPLAGIILPVGAITLLVSFII